jgi:NAD(P)H-quinone oxidoreductase subunit 5
MPLFRIPDSDLFRADHLASVMAGLILFVIVNVTAYSSRYLAGDRNRRRQQLLILLLGICVLCIAFADHLLVMLIAWTSSNLLLVRLMIHKAEWMAARNSGLLALKTFGIGITFLGAGFWLLAETAGTASISGMISATDAVTTGTTTTDTVTSMKFWGLLLVALAAMTQSAAWPFHRWLISSLNSPPPVSALMHAGLINGGGFLIVRFGPLYATQPVLLHGLFVVGLVTAFVGNFWKLIQTDVKRMLACSTMGQMGFMLMQCGMGLFAPAVSHLCWHGLFKAYLFLNAGSVVHEQRTVRSNGVSPARVAIASLAGVMGVLACSLTSGIDFHFADTGCIVGALAFMASTQLAIGLLGTRLTIIRTIGTLIAGLGTGGLYGLNICLVETILGSFPASSPQPMDAIYFAGLALIYLVWIAMLLNLPARLASQSSWKRLYMSALNASQPHPQTVTATRASYRS